MNFEFLPEADEEFREAFRPIRRKVLSHFPCSLLYSIESDLILIVAVAHQKRRPTYWRSRVKNI